MTHHVYRIVISKILVEDLKKEVEKFKDEIHDCYKTFNMVEMTEYEGSFFKLLAQKENTRCFTLTIIQSKKDEELKEHEQEIKKRYNEMVMRLNVTMGSQ